MDQKDSPQVDLFGYLLDLGGIVLLIGRDQFLCEMVEFFDVYFVLVHFGMEWLK